MARRRWAKDTHRLLVITVGGNRLGVTCPCMRDEDGYLEPIEIRKRWEVDEALEVWRAWHSR